MKNQKGFTLLEMMIVVAIMGMLAGAFMPSLFNQLDKADEARVGHDLNQLSLQLKYYMYLLSLHIQQIVLQLC